MLDASRLPELATFAEHHVRSGDIDPAYPVLRWIEKHMELDPDAAVWATLMYCAWYDLPSAVQVINHFANDQTAGMDWPAEIVGADLHRLPTGIERRGLRGGQPMVEHLDSLNDLSVFYGSFTDWLMGMGESWSAVTTMAGLAYGNGRWATYKLCELLQEVNGWGIEAPDMGNDGSSGPVRGLERFYGPLGGDVTAADRAAADLRSQLGKRGVSLSWSKLETVLCDFNSMWGGHYYVGHDIDLMQQQTLRAGVPQPVRDLIWEARKATLPNAYLGELNGWTGVDAIRRKLYADHRHVATRE